MRLRRGAYVEAAHWTAASSDSRELLTALSYLHTISPPQVAIASRAAAALHGMPLVPPPGDVSHFVRRGTAQTRAGFCLHRDHGETWLDIRLTPGLCRIASVPVISAADTCAHLALWRPPGEAIIAADWALRHDHLTREDLSAAVDRHPRPGWHARELAELCSPHSESPLESLGCWHLRRAGVSFVQQPRIDDGGPPMWPDAVLTDAMVAIEFDGDLKYRGATGEALIKEKRREDRLRRLGYVVVRVTWADVMAGRLVPMVRAAVRTASPSAHSGALVADLAASLSR